MGGCLLPEPEAGSSLHRSDTGSFTGQNIFERPPSEGAWCVLESGQGQTEGENTGSTDILKRMFRDVIIGAIFDLGTGNIHEYNAVVRWMSNDSFDICCSIASWDEHWLKDLFRSVSLLPDSVRKVITKECLEMLKVLARLDSSSNEYENISDHISRTNAKSIAYPVELDSNPLVLDSKFSVMSQKKMKRKRNE